MLVSANHSPLKMSCRLSSISSAVRRFFNLSQGPTDDVEKASSPPEAELSVFTRFHAHLKVSDARKASDFLKYVFDGTNVVVTRVEEGHFEVALSGQHSGGTTLRFITRHSNEMDNVLRMRDYVDLIGLRMGVEVSDLAEIRARLDKRSCSYQVLGESGAIKFYLE